jgi:hypothetical protein
LNNQSKQMFQIFSLEISKNLINPAIVGNCF